MDFHLLKAHFSNLAGTMVHYFTTQRHMSDVKFHNGSSDSNSCCFGVVLVNICIVLLLCWFLCGRSDNDAG